MSHDCALFLLEVAELVDLRMFLLRLFSPKGHSALRKGKDHKVSKEITPSWWNVLTRKS
jgi:hypothetical protein